MTVSQSSHLLALYLQQEGYTPVQHHAGAGALERVQELKPALIILNATSPDQDSWTVPRTLKSNQETKDFSVLVTSAPEDRAQAFDLGAAGHLTKPVHRQDLRASFERLMQETKILLVDDDPEMIALLQAMLPADWCASLPAHNGVEGLALASSERPDATFLDLMLRA